MSAPSEQRLLSRVFVFAWLSLFFHSVATNAYVHLPGFLKKLGATELLIGTLSGLTAALSVAARPVLGGLIDRMGRRSFLLVVGAVHVALCCSYCAVSRLGLPIYLIRCSHGVVEAMMFSALFTYAAEIVPVARRTEGIAWFGVGAQVPVAIGALFGDFVLARASYTAFFLGTTGFAALGLLASFPLPEQRRVWHAEPSRGFLACALQRDLLPLWFVGVVFATAITPSFVFLKTFVMNTHVGSVGLFLGVYSMTAAALRLFLGWLPDRVGPKKTLVPAVLAVAVGMFLVMRARTSLELALAAMLGGAGHGFAFPILVGLVVHRSKPSERAIAVSLITSVFDAGQLIGGPVFGAVIEAHGHRAAFGVASAIATFGVALFIAWDRIALRAGSSPG